MHEVGLGQGLAGAAKCGAAGIGRFDPTRPIGLFDFEVPSRIGADRVREVRAAALVDTLSLTGCEQAIAHGFGALRYGIEPFLDFTGEQAQLLEEVGDAVLSTMPQHRARRRFVVIACGSEAGVG